MDKNKITLWVFISLGALVIFGTLFFLFRSSSLTEPKTPSSPAPAKRVPPTLSEEQIEIIRQMETHVVTIKNNRLNPTTIQIKTHDQVEWDNQTDETYQITGEGWGNVPLRTGRKFSQAFNEPGTYLYSCTLHPDLKGTVEVTNL